MLLIFLPSLMVQMVEFQVPSTAVPLPRASLATSTSVCSSTRRPVQVADSPPSPNPLLQLMWPSVVRRVAAILVPVCVRNINRDMGTGTGSEAS